LAITKFLLFGLIMLLGSVAVMGHVSASGVVTITASGNIVVKVGSSGFNSLIFGGITASGYSSVFNVEFTCTGFPTGASYSPMSLPGSDHFSDGDSFQLTVTTSPSTPVGTYPITCVLEDFDGVSNTATVISRISFFSGASSLGPNSISIQQSSPTFNLIVNSVTPIPEYPLGLPLLAIFMIVGYGVIKRKTVTKQK